MGVLWEYVDDQGMCSCSGLNKFLPSNSWLVSTPAAGLEVADLSVYLAAEVFVGRLFRWLLVQQTSHILGEILYYTNMSLSVVKPPETVQALHVWDQSNKPWWQIYLFSALPKVPLTPPTWILAGSISFWLCSLLALLLWLYLNPHPTAKTLRKLWWDWLHSTAA